MKNSIQLCRSEAAVERAASLSEWTEELQKHSQICTSCAALRAMVEGMKQLACDSMTLAPKPDPKLLVLQAHLRELQARRQKQRMLVNLGLGACTIASSTGLMLSRIYGAPQTNATLPSGALEALQNTLASSWPFCLLLATLAVVWIVFESGASEQN
jgi:hypothetical protein